MVDIPYQRNINFLWNLVFGDEAGFSIDRTINKQSYMHNIGEYAFAKTFPDANFESIESRATTTRKILAG